MGSFVIADEEDNVSYLRNGPPPASAIVQPFNYSPPVPAFEDVPTRLPTTKKNVTVRRNNSYASSMGRGSSPKDQPKIAKAVKDKRKHHDEGAAAADAGPEAAKSASVVVTLV